MDKALSGQMKSLWANYRIRPDRFSLLKYRLPNVLHNARKLIRHYPVYRPRAETSNGLVVKFIRANLMLGWLAHTYKHRILLVIRHPAAVVASRINMGTADWDAETALSRYLQNKNIPHIMRNEFGVDIAKPMTPAAIFTCVWCIENLLPLRWAKQFGFPVTAYETLLAEPDAEWARLGQELGLDRLPDQQLLESPSQQVARDMQGKKFGKSHLGKWRISLNEGQLRDIQGVLDDFGIQIYNTSEDMPIITSNEQ
ncbi:MAG: hypothetical protein ACE5FQ_13105 [Thiogranum sp.]